MKHTVTLEESDLKEAVGEYIAKRFPNYTAEKMRVNHSPGHGPMERSSTTVTVDLTRAGNTKD